MRFIILALCVMVFFAALSWCLISDNRTYWICFCIGAAGGILTSVLSWLRYKNNP